MKSSQTNLLVTALFFSVVGLSGCTGHDKMEMNDDMKHDTKMMKIQTTDGSHNKMTVSMTDPAKSEMDRKMDTMKTKMDEPMDTMKPEMKKTTDTMTSGMENSKEGEMKTME